MYDEFEVEVDDQGKTSLHRPDRYGQGELTHAIDEALDILAALGAPHPDNTPR